MTTDEEYQQHLQEAKGRSVADLVMELYASAKVQALTLVNVEKRLDKNNGNVATIQQELNDRKIQDAKVEGALLMIRGVMALALFVVALVGAFATVYQMGWIG